MLICSANINCFPINTKILTLMDLTPGIPLVLSFPAIGRYGGIAVNVDGTLLASVDDKQHCVYIYRADGEGEIVVGTPGTSGSADGELLSPRLACFVHRNGADTLLICDSGNDRIVEVTASGVFLRAMPMGSYPWGIAYCGKSDVIAVTLVRQHSVILLQYESGLVKPGVTIGSRTAGNGPMGVAFTADGDGILVVDHHNHRVSKFSAVSGAFITHVATKAANGIFCPVDVLQCEDGSIFVAHWGAESSVVQVGADGVTVHKRITRLRSSPYDRAASCPISLSYSQSMHGMVVKTLEKGHLFLLRTRDAWVHSSRCAWISSLSMP